MKTAELLERAFNTGVILELNGADKIKLTGDKGAIRELLPEIKEHKAELVRLLSGDQAPVLPHGGLLPDDYEYSPAPCKGCAQCEVIMIEGQATMAGCVRRLDTGPWAEVWHRLPADLQRCILH